MATEPWWRYVGRMLAPAIDRVAAARVIVFLNALVKQFFLVTEISEAELKEANQINPLFKEHWVALAVRVILNPLKGVNAAAAKEMIERHSDFLSIKEMESTSGRVMTYLTRTRILRFDQLYRGSRVLLEGFLARVKLELSQGIADPEELRIYNQFQDLEEQEARRVANQDSKIGVAVSSKDEQLLKERERADQAEREVARLRFLTGDDKAEIKLPADPDRRNKPR